MSQSDTTHPQHARPESLSDLFWSFTWLALQGFGGVLAGMLAFPLLIVLALAAVFAGIADSPGIQGALRGLGAVAAGLVTATGLKLVSVLKTNTMVAFVCSALAAITFIAIALFHVPLAWVHLSLGGLTWAWAYRQLGKVHALEACE